MIRQSKLCDLNGKPVVAVFATGRITLLWDGGVGVKEGAAPKDFADLPKRLTAADLGAFRVEGAP